MDSVEIYLAKKKIDLLTQNLFWCCENIFHAEAYQQPLKTMKTV